MKTGFYELDNIVKLNSPQLIVCSSADYVIESFFTNILRNISVDQKVSTLYIDNNLKRDCTESIRKEREILFNNKKHEMEIIPMLMEVTDNTLDDIVSSITMLDRDKIMDNRIVDCVYTQGEIRKLSKNNTIDLIDIIDDEKYIVSYKLFNKEEREKIQEADLLLKSSPLFLKHIESITLNDFKEVCFKYKTSNKTNIIILNDINTIKDSSKLEILKELQELSKKLNITIIIGYNLIKKEIISLECELENIKQKCNYIDTIFLLREGTGEDLNILHIWVIKNKNKTLGKVSLLYLEDYKKCVNIERYIDIECEKNKLKAIEDINMKFFNGIMSPSWYEDIDLWFSKYGFDEQVMVSLFKYCYERCAMHIRYIQKVAKEWAENNIKTPKDLELYIQKKEEENG